MLYDVVLYKHVHKLLKQVAETINICIAHNYFNRYILKLKILINVLFNSLKIIINKWLYFVIISYFFVSFSKSFTIVPTVSLHALIEEVSGNKYKL